MNEQSLYSILSGNINTKVYKVLKDMEAVVPTKEDCELLSINKTTAIQLFHSKGYNKFETPVEYTVARFRGDKKCIPSGAICLRRKSKFLHINSLRVT